MPHVLQMQRSGARASANYFVTDSLCCPSRASIFTGQLPARHAACSTTAGPTAGSALFHARGEEQRHVRRWRCSARGYRTALMGKYLNGYKPEARVAGKPHYVPPGWSEWDVAGDGYPEFGYHMNSDGSRAHVRLSPARLPDRT